VIVLIVVVVSNNAGKTTKKITINSNPTGATVFINNENKGKTPYSQKIMFDTLSIKLTIDGYEDFLIEEIITDKNNNFDYILEKVDTIKNIIITSKPSGAKVFINKIEKGITPFSISLQYKTFEIKLTKEGYQNFDVSQNITKQTDSLNYTLIEYSPTSKQITITSNPTGATVFINNERKGTTPYTGTLNFGNNSIKLTLNDYNDFSKTENISATSGNLSYNLVKSGPVYGSFTDSRDGKTYKTVKIGSQTWLAENLAYKPSSGNYWAYNNDQSNVSKYGYLYDYETACKVCPSGWHLPSDAEWNTLEIAVGLSSSDAQKEGWRGTHANALKTGGSSGFNVVFGGYRLSVGSFRNAGSYADFWSSSAYDGSNAWRRSFHPSEAGVDRYWFDKQSGFSVRCVRDN
jgi:uncharacterized protein (TIGR02145 family)